MTPPLDKFLTLLQHFSITLFRNTLIGVVAYGPTDRPNGFDCAKGTGVYARIRKAEIDWIKKFTDADNAPLDSKCKKI